MRRRRRLVLLVLNVPRTGIRSGSSDCNSWLMHACDDCCNTVPVGLIFATHLSLSLSPSSLLFFFDQTRHYYISYLFMVHVHRRYDMAGLRY